MKKVRNLKSDIVIGYARVSSSDNRQELGLSVQIEVLKHCDRIFFDKESGAHTDRLELAKALKLAERLAQSGRNVSLVIYKLDRLSRQMSHLLRLIDRLKANGIQLISLKENLETNTLTGQLLCILLGYVAEMELENIRLRTKEGLRKAREKGVKLGGKSLSKHKERQIVQLYEEEKLSLRQISKTVHVSTSTIYRVLERNGVPQKSKKA